MKSRIGLIILSFALLGASPGSNDDINNIVQEEYRKIASEHSETNTRLRKKVNELAASKARIVAESRKRAEMETAGIDLIKKYSVVIASKYRNETTSNFESGLELSSKDQENVSKILGKYLSLQPLSGRVSAGEGLRQLDMAARRLQELAKLHTNPTEANNSELEILAFQVKDADMKLRKLSELARNLGLQLVDNSAPEDKNDRAPASEND